MDLIKIYGYKSNAKRKKNDSMKNVHNSKNIFRCTHLKFNEKIKNIRNSS